MDWSKNYKEWIECGFEPPYCDNGKEKIDSIFRKFIDFGTGGMRGKVGIGTNRINTVTIERLALALVKYYKERHKKKIIIAFDNRTDSKNFSEIFIRIFIKNDFQVYYFNDPMPTPVLTFFLKYYKADAGIMVTASHNSKEYNGVKVYNSNSIQLLPIEVNQIREYLKDINLKNISSNSPNDTNIKSNKNIHLIKKSKLDNYYIFLKRNYSDSLNDANVNFIFSPLHGVTGKIIQQLFELYEVNNCIFVKEQFEPDKQFSTLVVPNPEKKDSYDLSISLAKSKKAEFILLMDTDGDRLGVAIKNKNDYQILTGNEIGSFIFKYLIDRLKDDNCKLSEYYFIKTIVTSEVAEQLAKTNGINVINTLTGFKYIGEKINDLERQQKKFLFAFEESNGYLINPFVKEKDAFQAALTFINAFFYYKNKNISINSIIRNLYEDCGISSEFQIVYPLNENIDTHNFRNLSDRIRSGEIKFIFNLRIKKIVDYYLGYEFNLKTKQQMKLSNLFEKSELIKIVTSDNSCISIRFSGTESILKVYYSLTFDNKQKIAKTLQSTDFIIEKYINL